MPRVKQADVWAVMLSSAAEEFEINTPERLAAFLGQVAVETGELRHLVENLSYSAERLQRVFKAYRGKKDLAEAEAMRPDVIANRVYANRNGNGDIDSGDGWKFRAMSPMMI